MPHPSTWIRPESRAAIYARDEFSCAYCGKSLAGEVATLDHLRPRSFGGSNRPSNLVTCCVSCNSAKQDKLTGEFVAWLTGGDPVAMEVLRRKLRRLTARGVKRRRAEARITIAENKAEGKVAPSLSGDCGHCVAD